MVHVCNHLRLSDIEGPIINYQYELSCHIYKHFSKQMCHDLWVTYIRTPLG